MTMTRHYVSPEQARAMTGLRIAFTRDVPGPWSEAIRAIFDIKRIPYVAVEQVANQPNKALVDWTGQSSAPCAMLDDERPRVNWWEMVTLAERLNPEPALIPHDEDDRATMFGLCHAIAGEDGLGWSIRHLLLSMPDPAAYGPRDGLRYKFSTGVSREHALARANAVIAMLARRLEAQGTTGGAYLIGDRLSAADIYWTTFSNLLVSMPAEQCPMPDYYRDLATASQQFGLHPPAILLRHRDRILVENFDLPMWF
jgi:glutathione S-transferase